jgi:putative flippase GtrA
MKVSSRKRKLYIQAVEYMISGGVYFWSGYAIFAVTWSWLHWSLWWAKLASNIVGWITNYALQRYWVFSNNQLKNHTTKVTGRYAFITLVDFGLDYLIVAGLKSLGLTPYLGQFASAGFFTFWNYLWYRFWVFPENFKKGKPKWSFSRLLAHRAHGHSAYRGL